MATLTKHQKQVLTARDRSFIKNTVQKSPRGSPVHQAIFGGKPAPLNTNQVNHAESSASPSRKERNKIAKKQAKLGEKGSSTPKYQLRSEYRAAIKAQVTAQRGPSKRKNREQKSYEVQHKPHAEFNPTPAIEGTHRKPDAVVVNRRGSGGRDELRDLKEARRLAKKGKRLAKRAA